MGLYEHWPYVNFHELNLNFILIEMKQIREEMEDIREWKAGWEDTLNDLNNKYIALELKYNQLEYDFQNFTETVNNNFDQLSREFIQRFAELQASLESDISGFKTEVLYKIAGLEQDVNDLDVKLDRAIDNLADSMKMANPFTGQEEPFSQIILYLASFHMTNALTAREYDSLGLTAGEYDSKNLTAYQYDIEGKTYLMP